MPRDAIETLRRVNHDLRSALLRLRPERRHCSRITPQDFSEILTQLLRASECLVQRRAESEALAFEKEARDYRCNLEALKHFLPDLHMRLLAEKARLETARRHVAAAAAWAQAGKNY